MVDQQTHFCPLCDCRLIIDGEYYQCSGNIKHRIHIVKEWQPYTCGEKDRGWLRWRMKVRFGKLLQGEQSK